MNTLPLCLEDIIMDYKRQLDNSTNYERCIKQVRNVLPYGETVDSLKLITNTHFKLTESYESIITDENKKIGHDICLDLEDFDYTLRRILDKRHNVSVLQMLEINDMLTDDLYDTMDLMFPTIYYDMEGNIDFNRMESDYQLD